MVCVRKQNSEADLLSAHFPSPHDFPISSHSKLNSGVGGNVQQGVRFPLPPSIQTEVLRIVKMGQQLHLGWKGGSVAGHKAET